MIESDHNESDEGDMEKLHLSSDSIDTMTTKKRLRAENSGDETTDVPTKKWRGSLTKQSEILKEDNTEVILDKSGTDKCDAKETKPELCPENRSSIHKKFPSESNMENKEKQDDKSITQENGNKSPLDRNFITNENTTEANIKKENVENEDSPSKKLATDANVIFTLESVKIEKRSKETIKGETNEEIGRKEKNQKDGIEKEHVSKNRSVDTEVVDGLELSVECASDKEEPSSESEDEKNVKPRPRTIIVKAKPNESELECSSSEKEKSDLQEANTLEIKSKKKRGRRRGPRTSFRKLKASESEDSQNNNSDEDYSPRAKKKMIKSPTTRRSTKRSVESKRGRGGGVKRNSHKKSTKHISDDENEDMISEKANKTMNTKNSTEEELSEKESLASKSESDNHSEDERSMKSRKNRRSNARPEDNKHIQMLKRYLSIAGVKVRSYHDIWSDCKSNAAKIRRLKELLEKNGITGRPTLEKCKRAREEKEKMQEISELDVSNIISEGRVTRARRNMDNRKTILTDTPPRQREARNTLKRIQTVVDSDSE